ncbi:RNA dependent RNA polymerase-domain-containing protein [Mycotypha africana]|uniref:RNA dependent RNA polymerase-domain-containing protein n=1 Tax=Mycotypha africana TaxID=64632 RepID=UPI002300397A|nr:RNA dependent RNA polymerase-domain-containing protein [Mycotypha africana]KAI8977037.1 RNA dependent RNA polymerase-domain-containing protein [Mycotypha africana]
MTSDLDPFIARCAKAVYNNLRLPLKIQQLSNVNNDLPVEILKMQQVVALLDKNKLDAIIKKFLQNGNPKKSIQDLIDKLDSELQVVFSLDEDVAFDDIDTEVSDRIENTMHKPTKIDTTNIVLSTIDTTPVTPEPTTTTPMSGKSMNSNTYSNNAAKKRLRSPTPELPDTTLAKKLKVSVKKSTPLRCFSDDESTVHNIICNPAGASKLFSNVPWIYLYEIARFVQAFQISWSELPFDAFQQFLVTANNEPHRLFEVMVKWNQETRLGVKVNGLAYTQMTRCPDNVWAHVKQCNKISSNLLTVPTIHDTSEVKIAKARMKNRMIHYSGIIRFKTSSSDPSIILRAPKVEASNRLFRKFGQDRFLELKLAKGTHPTLIKRHKKYFLKPFVFMQRVFKFLFVKEDMIILFATEGVDLQPISIQEVIDWHMPISENWNMSMSKYASRMSLGYSSSIPTLQFKPEEIIYIDDVYASEGSNGDEEATCMTDGCGIISCSAMKEIMGCQAADELPCAVQGRIAGAKGIWIVSPDLDFSSGNWIKIRKSQNKFKTGLPQADLSLDPHHYTFDLIKNSICIYPSNLNTQFIQCLAAGGVPTAVFIEILKEYVNRLATIVVENQSIKLLRDWVAKTGNIMTVRWEDEESVEKGLWNDMLSNNYIGDDENDSGFYTMSPADLTDAEEEGYEVGQRYTDGDTESSLAAKGDTFWAQPNAHKGSFYARINKYSGFPCGLHESVIRLLDAGFDLSNAYVATRVTMIFRQIIQAITIKYKIEIAQSCTVTCIPDPTGTLNEGEIFLQLSSRRKDEKTGVRAGQVLGDVIVTRNPCGHKSDIQKVKAVDCTALRMYTDIAVFSIKGSTSLASQLSGGDYDGDIVFCCWDERIVKPFKSSPVPPEPSRVREAFDKDESTVGGEVSAWNNPEEAIQNNFISVAIPDGTLGIYENWRTVLAERTSLDNPDVVYLAHMCAKLVDAPKQGLRLKASAKHRDRSSFAELPYPDAPLTTTMDYLYDTLLKETAAFTRYSRSMFYEDDVPFKDPDLIAPYMKACELANQLNDTALKKDLESIVAAVNKNRDEYNKQVAKLDEARRHFLDNVHNPQRYFKEKLIDDYQTQFNSHFELEEYFAKDFLHSPPNQTFSSNILIYDIQANGGRMLQNIKASYAYTISVAAFKYSKYCYIVAYDALRRIKADACAKQIKENGLCESVAVSSYKCMNIDRKWVRRLKEANYREENVKEVRVSEELFQSRQ